MRKVSKQVAMGFIERTLVRCKTFELTGQSCFSDPALQNVLFAAPEVNDAGASIAIDRHNGHGAPKCRLDTTKAGIVLYFSRRIYMTYNTTFFLASIILPFMTIFF